ncbi:hypothetical protein NXS19_000731 [Fusarium pseudograminearum]|nr:hypothetical protein NXS19_000731 [Fusarium pseudograminearum]
MRGITVDVVRSTYQKLPSYLSRLTRTTNDQFQLILSRQLNIPIYTTDTNPLCLPISRLSSPRTPPRRLAPTLKPSRPPHDLLLWPDPSHP